MNGDDIFAVDKMITAILSKPTALAKNKDSKYLQHHDQITEGTGTHKTPQDTVALANPNLHIPLFFFRLSVNFCPRLEAKTLN